MPGRQIVKKHWLPDLLRRISNMHPGTPPPREERSLRLHFACPSTGQEIETTLNPNHESLLLLPKLGLSAQCSFCGGTHQWSIIEDRFSRE